jgi:hypothetical protein
MSDKLEKQIFSAPSSSATETTGIEPATSEHAERRGQDLPTYRPRTSLGQRLWSIRARLIASGEPLLTWDDIDRELAERRGERESQTE